MRVPLLAVASLLVAAALDLAPATAKDAVDTAPCLAAIAANADEKIVGDCGVLIDNDKAAKDDRIKALIARARAFTRNDELDRAIADYDAVLQLDPALADVFNDRGELWWMKGDRPKAVADFAAAIKLDPDHPAARGNYKRLALELERLGAQMAVAGKPSFDCTTARRAVEKTICASPELADLDRQINDVNSKVVREAGLGGSRGGRALQREQDEFLAQRNVSFGRPGYDLHKAMRERLNHLLALERH
jgi:tetratricopeptide (TPR) repeat protein